MDGLLQFVLDAHGGLSAWERFNTLKAQVSIGGGLWEWKGQPGVLSQAAVEISLREQRSVTHLPALGRRIVFTPRQVHIETEDGETLETRDDPRALFPPASYERPWDLMQVGYFGGYTLTGYLRAPFLYAGPGFEAAEVEPWDEDGERWRVLQVTFPESFATHTRTQFAYFGPDGLLRRLRYQVDVMGGAKGVNYAYDYRSFQGIMIPTRRRVFAYDDALRKVPEPLLVSIDASSVELA